MMMYNAHVGQEDDIPAGCTKPLAQIGFLGIDKILFIEQPNFLQCLLPDHHEAARQGIHFFDLIVRKELHVFA